MKALVDRGKKQFDIITLASDIVHDERERDHVGEPRAILDALGAHGLERVVCEGGPTLASRFVEARAIDELCVTVAPVIGPAPSPFIRIHNGAQASVHGMLVDGAGFSYLRLRRT